MSVTEMDRYDYDLPRELIAQHPLACRSDARLMIVDRPAGSIGHSHVRNLSEYLRPGDCLVVNDTRVVPARIVGYRLKTGGRWSGLFLRSDAHGLWEVIGRTRGRLSVGERIMLQDEHADDQFALELMAPLDGGRWAVRPVIEGDWSELLQRVGRVPLPPYIRGGSMEPADRQQYQTVYARQAGAIAAPTAGLHFTPALLSELQAAGVQLATLTLHVGIGTFRPVTVDHLDDHVMHAEWGCIEPSTVELLCRCRAQGGRIVAVGTTVVRLLETAAQDGALQAWEGDTRLFVRPGFQFRVVDALMTNFHLPRSTLLVLVRTFGGEELVEQAYRQAIDQRYRFYSYGDAMLIV